LQHNLPATRLANTWTAHPAQIPGFLGGGRIPLAGVWRLSERPRIMNHTNGWMGGGMWLWTVIGIAVVVLLIVVIGKLSKK
jgi:hypothetical protein